MEYAVGDATRPQGEGPKIIAHICNNRNRWGAGFVVAVSNRWPEPEAQYRSWASGSRGFPFGLGRMQLVSVKSDDEWPLWVANMVAQDGFYQPGGPPAIQYDALEICLQTLMHAALHHGASVALPRIGAGLGGGDWNEIEKMIDSTLVAGGVATTVYDLPS